MTKYVINGGKTLNGEVTISGAKNAAVAIVPAALLADGPVRLENVPKIIDVTLQMEIMRELGAQIRQINATTVEIQNTQNPSLKPHELERKLRASYYLLGVLLGRFICGFLCPFGWFQELLHKIPTKKFSTKRLKPLTYLKYVILVVMVFLLPVLVVNEAGMGDPFFCKYLCPQGVLEGAIPLSLVNSSIRAALGKLFSWKLCVLATVVVLSVVFYRPFCKWLCPLGAFYALFNRVSLLSMHVDESKCVSCGKCARTCPMDVDVTKTPNHSECIRCGKCVTACPTEAVRFRYAFGGSGASSKLSQKPIIKENKGE